MDRRQADRRQCVGEAMNIVRALLELAALGALPGVSGGAAKLAYKGTWADRPAANTLPDGSIVFITNYPLVGGFFKTNAYFNLYLPLAGHMLFDTTFAEVQSDLSGNDQKLHEIFIPAGMLNTGFAIEMFGSFTKSGATDTAAFKWRIGTTGTSSDTQICSLTLADSQLSAYNWQPWLKFKDAVTACVAKGHLFGADTSAWPADITVPDVTENDLYLTVWGDVAGTTDSVTLKRHDTYIIGL